MQEARPARAGGVLMANYATTTVRPARAHHGGLLTMRRLQAGDLLVKKGVTYFPLGEPALKVSRQWVKDRLKDGSITAIADYVYQATRMK